jgi:hypothetical protein
VKRLGAVIAVIACSALTTAMGAWPAQAASVHAASSAASATGTTFVLQVAAGAKDYVQPYTYSNGVTGLIVNPPEDDFPFVNRGCETATGAAGTGTYCHLQEGTQVGETNLCISAYKVALYGQLTMQSCTATGGGQQVDQLWYYDTLAEPSTLTNFNNGDVAYSAGDNGDDVYMGIYSGAPNNLWYEIT